MTGRHEIRTDNAHIRTDITIVAPRVAGYVSAIAVENNQQVQAGELLLSIDARDYAVRVDEAAASVAQAVADASEAQSRVDAQEAAIIWSSNQARAAQNHVGQAAARREAAQASADLTRADMSRFSELAAAGWFPPARLESAVAASRSAEAQIREAEAVLLAEQSEVSTAGAATLRAEKELAAARAAATAAAARVESMQARLAAARLDLERTQIRAPISGIVANRSAAVGQMQAPGQAALSIVPVEDAYVVANFKETQVSRMRPGQQVRISVDAYPELDVRGRVESLSPATGATFSLIPQDTATGNFTKIVQRLPVRISIDPAAWMTGLLRSGLAVEVVVDTRASKG